MPRPFHHATAEQVVAAVDAVYVLPRGATSDLVARFCDVPEAQADLALKVAVDMGLLSDDGGQYAPAGHVARPMGHPREEVKAAALRIVLESYEPFQVFRERLAATGSPDKAAQQTKELLDLNAHREEVKDTLISLGTYTRSLVVQGGGRYTIERQESGSHLLTVAEACADLAASEHLIRGQIGPGADAVSRKDVIVPLSDALMKAAAKQPREAVMAAGNAVDSYLAELGTRMNLDLTGATGINSKLERFKAAKKLPKKTVGSAKYLGHIRNAADHGIDQETGKAWDIQDSTGLEYVYVACSFIAACWQREKDGPFVI